MRLKTFDPSTLTHKEVQNYLHSAITPRPICFALTIDRNGTVNLSPFSFFNIMSINPPICVFSVTRRDGDNCVKDTLNNVLEIPECVINVVSYSMVQQTYITSGDYPKSVNEFVISGFTAISSETIRPFRVAESNIQLECKVNNVISLGDAEGAGNLIIAEINRIHINEDILDNKGKIDPFKLDTVARCGGDWYCRVNSRSLFKISKPLENSGLGIGVDAIPIEVKNSTVLTGNDLGLLGAVKSIPTNDEILLFSKSEEIKALMEGNSSKEDLIIRLHKKAKFFLDNGKVMDAWKVLLM